ncbi:hypothetical protein ABZX51_003392 [Aspergillus tubingensis]
MPGLKDINMLVIPSVLLLIGGALASEYDYIIVGGGTSGLTVANRLSQDPAVSVLVVEAGSAVFDNENVTDISNLPYTYDSPIDWAYQTTKQSFGDRPQVMRAGKALGGTSVMNGAAYARAEKVQFDALRDIGIHGWEWNRLLPYYMKSENLTAANLTQAAAGASTLPMYHGVGGPVNVGFMDMRKGENDLTESMNRTLASMGIPWNQDLNSGHMRGFTLHPYAIDATNIRSDAARAYYWPYAKRPNLQVKLNSFVTRILWSDEDSEDGVVAKGVETLEQGGGDRQKFNINARREVILAAGALRTPLILELSGVGNPRILEQYGITVKIDLPSVGENLQDQLNTSLVVSTDTPVSGTRTVAFATVADIFGPTSESIAARVKAQLPQYAEATANGTNGGMEKDVLEKLYNLQYDLMFKKRVPVAEFVFILESPHQIHTGYWGLLPFARGSVHINSSNPMAPPKVNPNYGMLYWDIEVQIAMSKFLRRMYQTGDLKNLGINETLPGFVTVQEDASDETWKSWIEGQYTPNYHAIGTTSMLPHDMGGVVNDRLKVYGTKNVRVVDASIQPLQLCGHPTANIYAIAEYVSDVIKQDS